jgi:hypothetical protein
MGRTAREKDLMRPTLDHTTLTLMRDTPRPGTGTSRPAASAPRRRTNPIRRVAAIAALALGYQLG